MQIVDKEPISWPTPLIEGEFIMASFPEAFYSSLSGLCGLGLLGPLPDELRHPIIFIGVFAVLFCLPLTMRKATHWRWFLMAFPIWWLGIAMLTTCFRSVSQNELPDMVGNIATLTLLPYIGLGLATIALNKKYRLATSGLIVANVYVTFFVTFICIMAATGNWI